MSLKAIRITLHFATLELFRVA